MDEKEYYRKVEFCFLFPRRGTRDKRTVNSDFFTCCYPCSWRKLIYPFLKWNGQREKWKTWRRGSETGHVSLGQQWNRNAERSKKIVRKVYAISFWKLLVSWVGIRKNWGTVRKNAYTLSLCTRWLASLLLLLSSEKWIIYKRREAWKGYLLVSKASSQYLSVIFLCGLHHKK